MGRLVSSQKNSEHESTSSLLRCLELSEENEEAQLQVKLYRQNA